MSQIDATTVLAVRRDATVVLASDGQVTLGNTVVKHHARKVRRLFHDRVLAGFAGSAADGFALFSRFEASSRSIAGTSNARPSNWPETGVRTACCAGSRRCSSWPTPVRPTLLSGTGDLIEPDDGVMGIGSGGPFAMAAARALLQHSGLDARAIVVASMAIAADLCIYTNAHVVVEEL